MKNKLLFVFILGMVQMPAQGFFKQFGTFPRVEITQQQVPGVVTGSLFGYALAHNAVSFFAPSLKTSYYGGIARCGSAVGGAIGGLFLRDSRVTWSLGVAALYLYATTLKVIPTPCNNSGVNLNQQIQDYEESMERIVTAWDQSLYLLGITRACLRASIESSAKQL